MYKASDKKNNNNVMPGGLENDHVKQSRVSGSSAACAKQEG